MEEVLEHEESEVKNDTERVVSAHSTNEEDKSSIPAAGHEKEDVSAEVVTSDHDEENSESMKAAEEEAFTSEPEEYSGPELLDVHNVTTDGDSDVKMNEASEQPLSHEESVVFEINSNDDDEPPRLHLETPQSETTRPAHEGEEEAKEEESTAAPADKEDINYEECLQELHEERDKASQHSSQLQMKLAECFGKKAGDDAQLEREIPVSEQLQEYEKYNNILTDLKQQLATDSEAAQLQAEELRLQSRDKLDTVGPVELWLDFLL